MTSSYTTNKSIEKPANGDYVNTWSTPVNNDWDIIDKAFGGKTTLNVVSVSGTVALTASQYQPPIIIMSGALTANINYQIPAGVGGFWFIYNNTSGSFSITFSSGGGGTSVTLVQGKTTAVISDGTNIGLADTNLSPAAGSNTQVQYNNGGLLGASSNFVFDTNKVGIGISSPKTTLQVTGSTFLNAPVLTSATGAPFYFTNADSAYGLVAGVNSADGHAWFQAQRTDGTSAAANITLNEAGGSVGVGRSNPGRKFDVEGGGRFLQDTAATTGAIVLRQNSGDTVGGFVQWVNNANTTEKGWMVVDTSSNMLFAPNSSEAMRITAAGNVGVGTSSPSAKFQSNGGSSQVAIMAAGTMNNPQYPAFGFDGQVYSNAGRGAGMYLPADGTLGWCTSATERMRITSAGNVGIGTATPSVKLDVAGEISATGTILARGAGGEGGQISLNNAANSNTAYFFDVDGSGHGRLFTVNNNTNLTVGQLSGTGGIFAAYTSGAERLRIDSSGNVGVGTTSPSNKLEVAGDLRIASGGDLKISAAASGNDMAIYNDNGDLYWNNGAALMYLSAAGALTTAAGITATTGNITATAGNVTAYSDARLKTDLQRIDSALDKVEKLAGYTFTRTDTGDRQTGLLAQDVQAVLPEAVVEGEYLSVAYGNLMGLMVEAIKELRAEVAELRRVAVKVNRP